MKKLFFLFLTSVLLAGYEITFSDKFFNNLKTINSEFEAEEIKNLKEIGSLYLDSEKLIYGKNEIIKISDCEGVSLLTVYNDKFDIINTFLIAFSFGNNEIQITRNYFLINKNEIIVSDVQKSMEWIKYPVKGEFKKVYEKVFIIKPSVKPLVKKTSYKKLYLKADEKLNKQYRILRKKLSFKERKLLKKTQLAWLKYINYKCGENYECLYFETLKRTEDFSKLINN